MQLAILGDVEAGEEQYFRVIETKTATLFSAAASVGGIVANCNAREVESLRVYGHNLGIAFQLVDDALDYGGESARLGKWVGNDFLQGKVTLPILLAFSRGNDDEKNFWRDKLAAQQRGTEDLSTAMSLVEKHDVLPKVLEKAKEYGTIAHDSLASFEGKYADALRGAVRFATDRKH